MAFSQNNEVHTAEELSKLKEQAEAKAEDLTEAQLTELFGPQANAETAQSLAARDIFLYRAARELAKKRGFFGSKQQDSAWQRNSVCWQPLW